MVIILTRFPLVLTHFFKNLAIQSDLHVKILFSISGTMGLAVWIIDDHCLVFLFSADAVFLLLLLFWRNFSIFFPEEWDTQAMQKIEIKRQRGSFFSRHAKMKVFRMKSFIFLLVLPVFSDRFLFFDVKSWTMVCVTGFKLKCYEKLVQNQIFSHLMKFSPMSHVWHINID